MSARYNLKIQTAGDGDLLHAANIVSSLRRARFADSSGEEMMAFQQMMVWFIQNVYVQTHQIVLPGQPVGEAHQAINAINAKAKQPAAPANPLSGLKVKKSPIKPQVAGKKAKGKR